MEGMDLQHPDDDWWKPWRWSRGVWLAAFVIWPSLYLLSIFTVEHWAGKEPGWRCTIVSIINAPLEPIRKPFRRSATRINPLYMPSNCEVCGEVAIPRFWERVSNDSPEIRLRSFCDQHNREYLDSPADALKPDTAW
jgi:hypothetical protein